MNVQAHPGDASSVRVQEVALALVLVVALTDCDRPAEPPPAAPAAAPSGRVVDVKLRRFECDERCWLEVELPDSSVISGWCNAPVCGQWLDNDTRLPAALVGRHARIKLRQDKTIIGTEEDGMEVEDFRAITVLE